MFGFLVTSFQVSNSLLANCYSYSLIDQTKSDNNQTCNSLTFWKPILNRFFWLKLFSICKIEINFYKKLIKVWCFENCNFQFLQKIEYWKFQSSKFWSNFIKLIKFQSIKLIDWFFNCNFVNSDCNLDCNSRLTENWRFWRSRKLENSRSSNQLSTHVAISKSIVKFAIRIDISIEIDENCQFFAIFGQFYWKSTRIDGFQWKLSQFWLKTNQSGPPIDWKPHVLAVFAVFCQKSSKKAAVLKGNLDSETVKKWLFSLKIGFRGPELIENDQNLQFSVIFQSKK